MKTATMVIAGVLLAAGIIWAVINHIGPCHSQHRELVYHPEYTTRHCTMHQKIGDISHCVAWRTQVHPARCAWRTTCDVRCKDWARGDIERHSKHEPHRTADVIDRRCE